MVNPLVGLVLCSPLHRLLSNRVGLLRFTGRQSGRELSTPVNFVEHEGGLLVSSRRGRLWWRNLRGGAAVEVVLRGQRHPGIAEVDESHEESVVVRIRFDDGLGV